MVTLDIPARRLDVDLSDDELAHRRAEWRAPQRALTGWLKRYTAMVTSWNQGAVLAV
jgi:dihydroxy-acid dehydratase